MNNNTLEITITSAGDGVFSYEYQPASRKVSPGGMVVITNNSDTIIYLESTGDKACPFTEAWPACIPMNETVLRRVPTPTQAIPNELKFPFASYDLNRPGIYGLRLVEGRVGDPEGDGEIIIE